MPARLTSFELHGYKTFASKTEFRFADGITAIVGPNGSGKSNIADAIRWVLGEQSYGLLRGKKTEDMIFAGSEQRSRAGMAQATVVFDNSDNWLPIDFSEVAITRRAYRDGDNEYLLNGQRVRLRDVSDLLSKSGLAERTYTVIGQGLVDAALALRAEDRRRLFEEAAGIGLYRSRRAEAFRRLDSTRRNLERVQDILAELQPRLRSLERQAKRAQEYEQIRKDLRESLRVWYGYHWHRAQNDYVEAQGAAQRQETVLSDAQTIQADLDDNLSIIRQELQRLRSVLGEEHGKLAELHQRRELIIRDYAVAEERIRSLGIQLGESETEFSRRQEASKLSQERLHRAEIEQEQMLEELEEFKAELLLVEQEYERTEHARQLAQSEVQETRNELTELLNRRALFQVRLEEKQSSLAKQMESTRVEENDINNLTEEMKRCREKIEAVKLQYSEMHDELKKTEADLSELQITFNDAKEASTRMQQGQSLADTQYAHKQAEINLIDQAEKNLLGYADGAQILVHSFESTNASGFLGVLGANLIVPDIYELAISAALGEFIGAIVFRDSTKVSESLDLLLEESVRGAIFPLDRIGPTKSITIDSSKVPGGEKAIYGIASELIQFSDDHRLLVDLLLGQVIVVKDRPVAEALLSGSRWQSLPGLRIVTLAGELYSASGMIAVGSSSGGVLGRPRKLIELRKELENLEKRVEVAQQLNSQAAETFEAISEKIASRQVLLEELRSSVRELDDRYQALKNLEENINNNLRWREKQKAEMEADGVIILQGIESIQNELALLAGNIADVRANLQRHLLAYEQLGNEEAQTQFVYWKTKLAVAEQSVNDSKRRYDELVADDERSQSELVKVHERINHITQALERLADEKAQLKDEEQVLNSEIEALRVRINSIEEEVDRGEDEQNLLLSNDGEGRQRIRTAEHLHAQAKISLARRHEALVSLRRRIEDDFGLVAFEYASSVAGPKPLPLDGMVEELPVVTDLAIEIEETIHQQKTQLKRIGFINIEAEAEYKEVSDRFSFLTDQVSDLHKAERDILEIISELDILMQREFQRTFDAVAVEFRKIFARLFNGGMARLVLTDPESIADTGIDIEARLPGRREQGLSLLSGGERSLTATALVFALLRISPTPFCILDEVDAMLDESNVGRFRELLTELSANTQFIVITHNRNTVQAASVIYGVTMGRDSTSQVISLKLDEIGDEFGV